MSAAMRQKLAELIKPIGSQEEWDEFIPTVGKKLLVIDIHKKWCGPCDVMRPTFERIFLNTDECDKKCEFLAVHSESGIKQLEQYCEKATFFATHFPTPPEWGFGLRKGRFKWTTLLSKISSESL